MNHRFVTFALIVPLLVGCDKRGDAASDDGSPEDSLTKVTKSPRPPQEGSRDPAEDLRASFRLAGGITSAEDRVKTIARIAWDAMELDPELAREAFGQLPVDGAERIRIIQHYAMTLAEDDLDGAMKWADGLGSEKETAAARCQIALVLSEDEPERAAALLSESAIAGREFEVAVVQVLQRWAATNPVQAAAWVAVFPPGKSREAGIKAVVSPWVEVDPRAVFSWMEKLTDPLLRYESSRAIAELVFEEPADVRDEWLRHAPGEMRAAIEAKTIEAGLADPPRSK